MQANSVPRAKRTKPKHNYASLNKKGLQSLKVPKVKSRLKMSDSNEIPATPSSGAWRVELLSKYEDKDTHGDNETQNKHDKVKQGKVKKGGKVPQLKQKVNCSQVQDNDTHADNAQREGSVNASANKTPLSASVQNLGTRFSHVMQSPLSYNADDIL